MWMCSLKHSNISLVHFNKCMRQSFETIFTACDFSTFLASELFSATFFHLFFLCFLHFLNLIHYLRLFLYYGKQKYGTAINLPWSINVNTNEHIQCEPLRLKERKKARIYSIQRTREIENGWNIRWKVCTTHTQSDSNSYIRIIIIIIFIYFDVSAIDKNVCTQQHMDSRSDAKRKWEI